MRVGFTGTRLKLTEIRFNALRKLLYALPMTESAHGRCVGGDEAFHSILEEINVSYPVVCNIHPPIIRNDRDKEHLADIHTEECIVHPPKPHFERNMDIATWLHVLVACPPTAQEILISGTWATIRYARQQSKPIYLVLPNGRVVMDTDFLAQVNK